jgi:hypothetical protein
MAHGGIGALGDENRFRGRREPHFPTTTFIGIPDFSAT